jgi:hypothetical protein
MQIVKRDGAIVEFDISKFIDALTKALSNFAEKIEEIVKQGMTYMHDVAHAVMSFFAGLFGHSSKKKSHIIHVYAVPLLLPDLKHIVLSFLEHSGEVRKHFLLTRHNRGNTDDTDTDISCDLITVF